MDGTPVLQFTIKFNINAIARLWNYVLGRSPFTKPKAKRIAKRPCKDFGQYPKKRTEKKSTSCCRIEATTGGVVMSRGYTKVEMLSDEVFRRKAAGETSREIGESYGLTLKQIKKLITRQNNKPKKIANGYVPRAKGRPRKHAADEETRRNNELIELRMQVELLRNFLSEAGRG